MAVAGILIVLVGAGGWRFWERARAPIVVAPAPAESSTATPTLPERRIALVIGNSSYAAGTLANTQRDAEALAGAFRRAGFAEVTLRLDLVREEILEVFQAFAKEAEGADWAVFYFAGRGMEIGGINYLVPIDARLASERDASLEAVTLDQVLQVLGGARKLRLAILDACRGDPFASEMMRLASGIRPTDVSLGKVGLYGATLVAYATKHGQIAEEGTGSNSPFATALVRNLDTPGLEVNQLFRRVRDEVLAATGDRQEPFIYSSLPADAFYFRQP